MEVTLIYPKNRWEYETLYPPLGLGYLAAVLTQHGFTINLIDGQILTQEEYHKKLAMIKSQLIGISSTINQLVESFHLAKILKASTPNSLIFIGGAGPSCLSLEKIPENFSGAGFILGEGEETIVELAQLIRDQQSYLACSNLLIKMGKNFNATPRKLMEINLDNLPFPLRELFPLERYLESCQRKYAFRSLSLIASRGCPFQCIFCDKGVSGTKYRVRSAMNIFTEINELNERYSVNDLHFYDDLFLLDQQMVKNLCELITASKIAGKISWSAQARVDLINEEILLLMKESGCEELYFGVESGNNQILKYLNKGFTVEHTIYAFDLCRKIGIRPGMCLIVGIPGETYDDLQLAKKLIKRAKPSLVSLSYLTSYPGTPLFERYKTRFTEPALENWRDDLPQSYGIESTISARQFHNELSDYFANLLKSDKIHPSRFLERS